jgi:glycosyltransferase involved in cell wall biosynthesis
MKNNRITVMILINQLGMGGAERQILELVSGMDKQRFAPIIASLYHGGALEAEAREIPGVEYICLNRKGKFDFTTLFTVYRLLRRKHVDVIHPFLTPSTFFGLVPGWLARTPVKMATERCGERVKTELGNDLYRLVEDFFTRFADCVTPNSCAAKDYLVRRGISPSRIQVVYNGVNLKRLTPDPAEVARIRQRLAVPPEGKVVGILARLSAVKDHATFLQAAKLISQEVPSTRFAIVGDGPLRNSLENQSAELGLTSKVVFFGPQHDVGSYITSFDIACLCSMDVESCSSVTVESMALGKPVVVTDIGGNKELVEHGKNGFTIPVRRPDALADAVLIYLRQPDLAREMGRRAEEMTCVRFGLERFVKEYQDLYETSVRKKRMRKSE